MDSKALIDSINRVTKRWAKQRKAEEKEARQVLRRHKVMVRCYSCTIKEAAYEIMETAYLKASANNTLPAHARQIMYAARGYIQEKTVKALDDQYFTQTLLPDYMNTYRSKTASWDVVFDARGHLYEPHTDVEVLLGTLQVREYLQPSGRAYLSLKQGSSSLKMGDLVNLPILCPTHGPRHRYQAILFIEKEGFLPLFKKVLLAERYDIAIMSTKGLSTTAARLLVDELCTNIPLFVLHDFDKAGFSIAGTLQRDTRRYSFRGWHKVVDLGLRLKDVEEYNLESEAVFHGRRDPEDNLRENGATSDEIEFLRSKRVELNAFASDELVDWIEEKLEYQGIQKLIPDDDVLNEAYRRAVAIKYIRGHMQTVFDSAMKAGKEVKVPGDIKAKVEKSLGNSSLPWDQVIFDLALQDINS